MLCSLRILKKVRTPSKYPILSLIYYTLLGYAVLNYYLANRELPSNSNEWASTKNIILTTIDYVRLFTSGDLTELSYDALLLFSHERYVTYKESIVYFYYCFYIYRIFDMGTRFRRQSIRRGDAIRPQETATNKVADLEPVEFSSIADTLETGDICLLYRKGMDQPHDAMFVKYEDLGKDSPLLLLKGKAKSLLLENFNDKGRQDVQVISASTRIFYGDYEKVLIHKLRKDQVIPGAQVNEIAETVRNTEFHENELKLIMDENLSDELRSQHVCTFMLAHVLSRLGYLSVEPHAVTPKDFISSLKVDDPISIKLPETRAGQLVSHGSPSFLAKLM